MCIFLKKENKRLDDAVVRFNVVQNLQKSKKVRLKNRISTLLLSKKGLGVAFASGFVKKLMQNNEDTKKSSSSKVIKIARIALSSWL